MQINFNVIGFLQKWLTILRAMNICANLPSLFGNVVKNWRDFKEQLQWFLASTESTKKFDVIEIGIMLSHAGQKVRQVYKPYLRQQMTTRPNMQKC